MREQQLHTICEEALCPNIGECWENRTATFLILGEVCTRNCGFCSVTTGRPTGLDLDEPRRLAEAVEKIGLRHIVITSVTRDDLPDGGAGDLRRDDPPATRACAGLRHRGADPGLPGQLGCPGDGHGGPAGHPQPQHGDGAAPLRRVRPKAVYAQSLELLKRAKDLVPTPSPSPA